MSRLKRFEPQHEDGITQNHFGTTILHALKPRHIVLDENDAYFCLLDNLANHH